LSSGRLDGTLLPRVVDGVVHVTLAGEDELGDGHEGVALLEKGVDDAGEGLWGVLGGVVEQDDGPRLDLAGHPLGDVGGGQVLPVQAVNTTIKSIVV